MNGKEKIEQAVTFLRAALPQSDWDCYPGELFLRFAEHACSLRGTVPWCADLDQEIFDHYVLCPRVNDEDLSFHRAIFFDALWPRIRDLETMEDRILEVNRWCHEMASYQMQDDRTASPLTVFRNGSGRCGEESAFLVAALRSVGIAARQVYVPKWSHCDDNHAWVEALCDGEWRFLGACEPEPILDRGWFNTPASRAILVHSRIFGEGSSRLHGSFLSREKGISWYSQTARYARTRPVTVCVLRDGLPAIGAQVRFQLLNEAGFHTVLTMTADETGKVSAELGRGDVHVFACLGKFWAEGELGESLTLELRIGEPEDSGWRQFVVRPPGSSNVNPAELSDAQKKARKNELRRGSALRQIRLESFERRNTENPQWQDLLDKALGNCDEIVAFLTRDGNPRREALLRTLTDKDLRDVTAEMLEDHLTLTPDPGELPEEIWERYVLCPRIRLEKLTSWRRELRPVLPNLQPCELWRRLKATEDGPLLWTPAQAWRCGCWNEDSRRILFAAILRSRGIPARLRVLDGMPEYWDQGKFCPVEPEFTGKLVLKASREPMYQQNWTLSRWRNPGWEQLCWAAPETELPEGLYRLMTAIRSPNGSQYAAARELRIRAGETTVEELLFQTCELGDLLCSQDLPEMPAATENGEKVTIPREKLSLLLWLEPGEEPTVHLLTELMEKAGSLRSVPVYFLLAHREGANNPLLRRTKETLHGVCLWPEDWEFDVENVARRLTVDPDTPPLAVVCSGNRAVYGVSGYRVGSGELLARIVDYLQKA